MSNPYVVNSSEVAAIFNFWKQTSTQGSRNTSLLQIFARNTVKAKIITVYGLRIYFFSLQSVFPTKHVVFPWMKMGRKS